MIQILTKVKKGTVETKSTAAVQKKHEPTCCWKKIENVMFPSLVNTVNALKEKNEKASNL